MNEPENNNSPKLIAGIPAYNEEKYIGTIVLKSRQYVDEVIVVDDGSADNTSSIANLAGATVIRHQENMGKGAAIQSILAEAKNKNPAVLVLLDADYQHNPDEIPDIVKPVVLDNVDLVIGSREQQKRKIPRYRRAGQKVLSIFSQSLSGEKVVDSECGFRALSSKALTELNLKQKGFAIETEMISAATEKNLKIVEVPISAIYTDDSSTLNPVRHGFGVLTRIFTMISERRPLLFFGIPGIILLIVGFLAGLHVLNGVYSGGVLAAGTAMVSILMVLSGVFCTFTAIILNAVSKLKD